MVSTPIEGIGDIQMSAFVYGSTWMNKAIKKKAEQLFPRGGKIYYVTFYIETLGDGILFFVDNTGDYKIHSPHSHLMAEVKKNQNILNGIIKLVKVNINEGRVFK